ncbi:autotransporter-associated beta strand repeat-containing protein [Bradyrhizobium guangdongense]
MRNRGALRPAVRPLMVVWLAAILLVPELIPATAQAQWIEAGPYTSTSTAASSPGILTSNTLVYGMSAQGNPIYGAVNTILQSPTDPNTYWAATTSGGIWKTTNGGVTWTPTTDHQPTLAIGAITIDSVDKKTMYAASGYYSAGAVNDAPQTMLLKSVDGGTTWQSMTPTGIQNYYLNSSGNQLTDSAPASIKNIIAMGNVVLVAAAGSQGHDSTTQAGGLYRSVDYGQTFTLLPGFNTEVTSLISATTSNGTVLFAARDGFNYRPDNGIFYSNDAGANWHLLLGPGTSVQGINSANANNLVFSGGFGGNSANMKIAAGPNDSLFVAVAKQNSYQPIVLFYTPQFAPGQTPTWYNLGEAYLASPPDCATGCGLEGNTQANLHFALVADPKQKGIAYIAGSGDFLTGASDETATIVRVDYNASTNAATYTPVVFPTLNSSPHPDTRSLVINSQGGLLATGDGGVYVLNNPGNANAAWSALGGSAANGSPIRAIEAYQAVMDPKSGRLGVAMQDNGAAFSAPTTLGQIKTGTPWQNVVGGDGFSVAVNYKRSGASIMYATADDPRLARVFADQNLSTATPPNMLDINVAGTGGTGFASYEGGDSRIVAAVNAVDPTKLLFRSARLYTWTDPGGTLSGSIDINDITAGANSGGALPNTNLFSSASWSEKIAYGTQDAHDAILAGGFLASGGVGVFLRTQAQANAGTPMDISNNLLASYDNAVTSNGAGNPIGVLFDPLTEHKFFITDIHNVYATNNTGATLRTLTLPGNFSNPAGLAYVADSYTGGAINGVRALLVGGTTTDGAQGSIISTSAPFASNVQWTSLGTNLPNAVVYGLNYYSDIDTLVAALYGRGVYVLYDVTSHYSTATALWFGKANNDSAPDVSLLTGNRPLEKFGTGTLTLSGAATYTGGTIIDAGIVAITADANLGAAQGGVIFNGGALQTNAQLSSARNVTLAAAGTFDAEADTTWSGTISGPGALNKIGPATLSLTGSNSYSGGTFIYGGALATGSDAALGDPAGQVGINGGTFRATGSFSTGRTVAFGTLGGAVDVLGGATLTANGLWAAQGPVTKTGSGELAIENVGIFQALTVGAGGLEIDGAITANSLQVAQGATLSGIGQITAPTTISGTLSPGSLAPGALTFTSTVALASTATLHIAIDGTGTSGGAGGYSQLIVNGGALTLGGTLQPYFRGILGGNNNFTPALGQQFLIASASGGVSGQFSGVDLAASGLSSSLRMDTLFGATFINLVTTPASYALAPAGSAWNANQQSAGAALDALRPAAGTISSNTALQNAFNTLYQLPSSQLGPVLSGLSAADEARGVGHALDAVDVFHEALQQHLLGGKVAPGFNNLSFSVSGAGRNFYSAYNSMAAPVSSGSAPRETNAPAAISAEHWWSSVYSQSSMTSTSAGITGGSANISGFIAGLEGEIKPGQLFGALASYSHTDASGNGSGSGDNVVLAAYGKRTAGPLQAAIYGGVAVSSIALHHDFGTGSLVNQSGSATSLLGGGSIAYTFDYRGFQIAPTATAAFTHMLFDGTSVTSPLGFAVRVPQQWTDRFRFTFGPTIARTVTTERGIRLTATVGGGFLYQTAPVTTLDGQIFTAGMAAQTAPAGGAGGYADAGIYASLTNWITGFVRWHGEARQHAHSNQVSGGLSVAF